MGFCSARESARAGKMLASRAVQASTAAAISRDEFIRNVIKDEYGIRREMFALFRLRFCVGEMLIGIGIRIKRDAFRFVYTVTCFRGSVAAMISFTPF